MDPFTAGFAIFGLAVLATGAGLMLRPHSVLLRCLGAGLLMLLGGAVGLFAPALATDPFVRQGVFTSSSAGVWAWFGLPGAAVGLPCGTLAAGIFFKRSVSTQPQRLVQTYFQAVLALTLVPVAFWILVIYFVSVRNR